MGVTRANAPMGTRALLGADPFWAAYALADLETEDREHCQWLTGERSVVLLYHGLDLPVLFAEGDAQETVQLARQIAPLRLVYTLLPKTVAALGPFLAVEHETLMWRMKLEPHRFAADANGPAVPLGRVDHQAILALFADRPDRPDAYHRRQLERGVFSGVWENGELLGVAGTHILAPRSGLAAVGNVYTHPARRGAGIARQTTGAVLAELLRRRYSTIVLNVAQDNEPAIRCYRRLGFVEHCAYHEGVGRLEFHPSGKGNLHG